MNSARAKSATVETPIAAPPTLPGMDASLERIATRLARHARPLLLANHALLLTITCSTQDDRARLSTHFWDARCALALIPPMAGSGALQRQVAALEAAASVLLANLICRWPANAVPPIVGIYTDGGGIAFSSDHPSPLSLNWLAKHQAGLCTTTTLLPFNPNGGWLRLTAPNSAALVN